MKTLIDAKTVETMKAQGQRTVCHNSNVLITPQARDMIRAYGMTIMESEADSTQSQTQAHCPHQPQQKTSSQVAAAQPQAPCGTPDADTVIWVLKSLADAGLLKTLVQAADRASKPYDASYDETGFKLVNGATVSKKPLETGNPADRGKVSCQEIIGSDDGAGFACGLIDMEDVCFNWQTECQEAYFIASGTISVTIADKTYSAHPGDAFFMKKGLSCAFSAQGKVNAFYVTY